MRIFVFHRVAPESPGWAPAMTPAFFEKCVRTISSRWKVLRLEDELPTRYGSSPDSSVACITFDDGFKDNLEYAVPILKKYGCPASFYVITDCVESGCLPWSHRFFRAFEESKESHLQLVPSIEELGELDVEFSGPQERVHFARELFLRLCRYTADEVECFLGELSQSWPISSSGENWMMDWNDLQALASDGFAVGSHTRSHLRLSEVLSEEEILRQLSSSRRALEEQLGYAPTVIAYPWGCSSESVRRLSREAGYDFGLEVGQRFVKASDTNPFAVPRMDLYADSGWLKTWLRMMGFRNVFWQ